MVTWWGGGKGSEVKWLMLKEMLKEKLETTWQSRQQQSVARYLGMSEEYRLGMSL